MFEEIKSFINGYPDNLGFNIDGDVPAIAVTTINQPFQKRFDF